MRVHAAIPIPRLYATAILTGRWAKFGHRHDVAQRVMQVPSMRDKHTLRDKVHAP